MVLDTVFPTGMTVYLSVFITISTERGSDFYHGSVAAFKSVSYNEKSYDYRFHALRGNAASDAPCQASLER